MELVGPRTCSLGTCPRSSKQNRLTSSGFAEARHRSRFCRARRSATSMGYCSSDAKSEGLVILGLPTAAPTAHLLKDARNSAKCGEESKARLERGLAVDLLREHLPNFFKEQGPMDIFSENVVFVDDITPHLGLQRVTAVGKENYASLLWQMRFHASLFCSGVQVDILRFWQPSPDKILVRWEITFCPRVLNGVYGTKMSFDGTSEFDFNREGKICRHRVDILNTDGLKFNLNLHFLLQHNNIHTPVPTC
ncbi:hypothetical protein BSKO_07752 [Bryopsis sp. KO-2023]|nr:hypothetical protein BSKO_07752 [Bryopsis sp. KO-2023]